MEVTVTGKGQQHLEGLARLFPKAMASALSKMAAQAKTEAGRLVPEIYNIKPTEVKTSMYVVNAVPDNLVAVLKARKGRKQGIPLMSFGVRKRQRQGNPLTVTIVKGQPRTLRDVFVTRLPSGHWGVFERIGPKVEAGPRSRYFATGALRQKIKEKFSIGPLQMISSDRVVRQLNAFVKEKLKVIVDHEIKFFGQ